MTQTNSDLALTGLLLDRLVRLGTTHYPQVYGELEISKPALVALVAIAAAGPLRQARLSDASGIDRASLVAVLNELESAGLATRGPDPHDRRAHVVTVTAQGEKLLARARELAEQDGFFSVLSADERETLNALLQRLIAAHAPAVTPRRAT